MRHAAGTFVGRSSELERLARLLEEGKRLITIWGVGGIGKSRLAHEFAALSSRRSWTVDVAEAAGAEGLTMALARALGVPVGSARANKDIVSQLGRSIASRGDALIVLDGFDHLVEAGSHALRHFLD
ncbi:MAG: ATP-binding protein, partial [Myxococcales bacterium]|nr:ATP-binding protein [Myxococcales bacterium]